MKKLYIALKKRFTQGGIATGPTVAAGAIKGEAIIPPHLNKKIFGDLAKEGEVLGEFEMKGTDLIVKLVKPNKKEQ